MQKQILKEMGCGEDSIWNWESKDQLRQKVFFICSKLANKAAGARKNPTCAELSYCVGKL